MVFVDMHVFVPAGARTHIREFGEPSWCQNVKERTSLYTRLLRHATATLLGDNCGLDFFSFHLWGCKYTNKSR